MRFALLVPNFRYERDPDRSGDSITSERYTFAFRVKFLIRWARLLFNSFCVLFFLFLLFVSVLLMSMSNLRGNILQAIPMFDFPFCDFCNRYPLHPVYMTSLCSSPCRWTWFWHLMTISWHLGSRRCCEYLRCEFYPAQCCQWCTSRSSLPLFLDIL